MDLRTNLNRFILLLDEKSKDANAKTRLLYAELKEDFWQLFGSILTPLKENGGKPYFARYVQVPGEIKEGDFGFAPDGKIIYFNKARAKFFGPECKKAKMFICSRNIQPGDEVIDTKGNKKIVTDKDIKKLQMLINSGEVSKIIGEPSPEATWVSEGQEFDKEDLFAHGIGHSWNDSHRNLKFKIKGPCGYRH